LRANEELADTARKPRLVGDGLLRPGRFRPNGKATFHRRGMLKRLSESAVVLIPASEFRVDERPALTTA